MKPPTAKEAKIKNGRISALRENLRGRDTASSSNLSRAYGLSVEEARMLMRQMGVREDD